MNLNGVIGEAILQACERAGFRLWVDEGSAQVRIRDKLAEPANDTPEEKARAAGHQPRALPYGLSADLNNKRGSVLIAIRERDAAAKRAAAAADPVSAESVKAPVAPDKTDMPKGVIRVPGFGDNPVEDPVKEQLSKEVTAVVEEQQAALASDPVKIPGNPSLDPEVDPLLNDVSQ